MAEKKDIKDVAQSFVPFYLAGAEIYMSLKESKDGLSREEDVDVLKGMYDQFSRDKNVGAKLRRALVDQQQRGVDD